MRQLLRILPANYPYGFINTLHGWRQPKHAQPTGRNWCLPQTRHSSGLQALSSRSIRLAHTWLALTAAQHEQELHNERLQHMQPLRQPPPRNIANQRLLTARLPTEGTGRLPP